MDDANKHQSQSTLIAELQDDSQRAESILILYGTGISMWQYYPFLRHFSLAQLQTFRHIYGVSGGAACLWYYGLEKIGLFSSDRIADFDFKLRSLNDCSLLRRSLRLLCNRYVYDTHRLADTIESFASTEARQLPFSRYPLKNFTAIGFDHVNRVPIYLNAESHPDLCMGDAMSSLAFPQKVLGRKLCKPINFPGFGITDLDFAPPGVSNSVINRLKEENRDHPLFICNIFYSRRTERANYVHCGYDRFPRIGQLLDFILLFLNIPNRRLSRGS